MSNSTYTKFTIKVTYALSMTFSNRELSFTQTLILTAGILLVIFLLVVSAYYYLEKSDLKQEFAQRIDAQISTRQKIMTEYIEKQRQRIQFIHSTPPISGIARASTTGGVDPIDGTQLEQWKHRLAIIFEGYLENNPHVIQMRYIGMAENGKELVRVERHGTNIKRIPENRLQVKGESDYFKEISQYNPNQVYISDMNLNREYGRIQIPHTATQRIAMPVFSDLETLFGFVIMNINPSSQIQQISSGLDPSFTLYLTNAQGGFLYHPDPEQAFLFELDANKNWQSQFQSIPPESQSLFQQALDNQSQSLFYYKSKHILLSSLENGRFIDIVIGVSQVALESALRDRTQTLIRILIFLLISVFFIFSFYQLNVHRRLLLLKSHAEFEAIVSGSHDGIISVNGHGIINSWNPAATDLTGYPERITEGQSIFDLLFRDSDQTFILDAITSVMKHADTNEFECQALTQKSKKIELLVNLSPIILGNGDVIGVAMMLRDITERKRIEQELLELNKSLEEKVKTRTQELEKARNLALQSNQMKSDFIANVSHEIRTPINGIIGMLELLKKGKLNEKQQHQIKMAQFSSRNLTLLVNDILDLSKIEAGKLEITSSEVNIIQLLSDLSSSLAIRAQEKNLEFILDTHKIEHEHILVDGMRLNQIITNLVGNALKFTQKGEIIIRAETQQDDAGQIQFTCHVIDTGKGIKQDKLDKLFESFTQEDSSITKQYGGTGLGLTICRQLCHLMQGEIRVESQEGQGSQFQFYIPVQENQKTAPIYSQPNIPKYQVLLASHNIRLLDALSNQFTAWQCKTSAVQNLSALLHLLEDSEPFNFILIDDHLATNITEQLSQLNTLKQTTTRDKIIILESSKSVQNKQHPFYSCIKPVSAIALIKALRQDQLNEQSLAGPSHAHQGSDIFKGKSILLVDDNDINLEVGSGLLEDLGIHVTKASSAQKCFDSLKKAHFDLILMDCQMPEVDGYTATKKIRNGDIDPALSTIPIIAMTAHAMSGARETCLAAGMSDYIPKPIDLEFVKQTLLKWLDTDNDSPTVIPEAQQNK